MDALLNGIDATAKDRNVDMRNNLLSEQQKVAIICALGEEEWGKSGSSRKVAVAVLRLLNALELRRDSAGSWSPSPDATITVEHILPQKPEKSSQWVTKHWPHEDEREAQLHKLGNLCLLEKRSNSKAQNFDWDEGKRTYLAKSHGFPLTVEVSKQETWTPEKAQQQHTRLLELAKLAFRL